jgi:TolB-like protein/Tfp pilus assembly protein PilF
MNFFRELKRRNVYKVAVTYAVVAWLLIQIATQTFPFFGVPGWAIRLVILLLVLGFPVALVIAWAFELTPEGLKRTDETPRRQRGGRAWLAIVVAAGSLSAGLFFLGRYSAPRHDAQFGALAKSIAILPFENRSEDKTNGYFADGIQDEILTRLAKIDDLKVISRTSTLHYKSSPENLPEIAKELGVAHILEGSVQKSGEQVRVNVQLINAGTDSHLWAEVYDRKLTDIFVVESEVAEKIADSLRAKLGGNERKELKAKPTENAEAYDAYLRGKATWDKLSTSAESSDAAVTYYKRAVQLDPKFAIAWAALAVVEAHTYAYYDRTPSHLAETKGAVDRAFELEPDLGDAWFALGTYRYRCLTDYPGALEAFEKAREHGVFRPLALDYSAYVKRRQGKWDEALALQTEAEPLDPRNTNLLSEHATTLRAVRRFAEAHRLLERALEITPNDPYLLAQQAEIYDAEGNLEAGGKLLERVPIDARDPFIFGMRIQHFILTNHPQEAIQALENALRTPELLPDVLAANYRGSIGAIYMGLDDKAAAHEHLIASRAAFESIRNRGHQGSRANSDLAQVCGFLGDAACVEREAARLQNAIDTDAYEGQNYLLGIATARTWLGQTDAAIEALSRLIRNPGNDCLTPALLRLDPYWKPLRGDPRFQELCCEEKK